MQNFIIKTIKKLLIITLKNNIGCHKMNASTVGLLTVLNFKFVKIKCHTNIVDHHTTLRKNMTKYQLKKVFLSIRPEYLFYLNIRQKKYFKQITIIYINKYKENSYTINYNRLHLNFHNCKSCKARIIELICNLTK